MSWSEKYGTAEYDLCKLFNGDYKLYKYYNDDEERYDEVPDILDYLYGLLDSAQDQYDDLMAEGKDRRAKRVSGSIEVLSAVINMVSKGRWEYYYVKDYLAIPIKEISLPVQTPDVVDGQIVWKGTGGGGSRKGFRGSQNTW